MSQGGNNKGLVKRADYEPTSEPKGKNYLLVIGIDKYAHCDNLNNAVRDAEQITQILHDKFYFEPQYTKAIFNEEATKEAIYEAFEYFSGKVTTNDNFILYYSGHGEYKDLYKLGYWIPTNSKSNKSYQLISTDEIKLLIGIVNSFHTVVFVDSCFSGDLFIENPRRNKRSWKETKASRWCLTSGRLHLVSDGPSGKNSPFAKALIKELIEAEDSINISDLSNSILEIVAINKNQIPRGEPIRIKGHDGGQFVFHLKQNEIQTDSYIVPSNPTIRWDKIADSPEENITQVLSKINNISFFLRDYPITKETQIAIDKGKYLQHKLDYLIYKDNLFALKTFALKATPFQNAALGRIKELELILEKGTEELTIKTPKNITLPKQSTKKVIPLFTYIVKQNYGTFTDKRDGQTYNWVLLKDDKKWMAQNLNFKTIDSWWYKNDSKNGIKYGRLYTWQAAKKACPIGWRLPTDDELLKMAKHYGGCYGDSNDAGKAAYAALIQGGSSGFSGLLSGYRYSDDGNFYNIGDSGSYWSNTEHDVSNAWYYSFYGDKTLRIYDGKKLHGKYCRYIQD